MHRCRKDTIVVKDESAYGKVLAEYRNTLIRLYNAKAKSRPSAPPAQTDLTIHSDGRLVKPVKEFNKPPSIIQDVVIVNQSPTSQKIYGNNTGDPLPVAVVENGKVYAMNDGIVKGGQFAIVKREGEYDKVYRTDSAGNRDGGAAFAVIKDGKFLKVPSEISH